MAKLISIVFHPFYILLLGVFIFFNTHTYLNFSYSDQLKLVVYFTLFINTIVIPIGLSWYLTAKGHISSIHMLELSDRRLIYFIGFILYLSTLFLLNGFGVPRAIYQYTFGATLTIGILFIFAFLNRKYSAHLAALGGLSGALIMLAWKLNSSFTDMIFTVIILAGIVAWSRIKMQAHTETEVYIGFLIGFFAQVFIFI
jgi:hypothetical protein